MSELLELPFDQYQRYRLVADLVGPLAARRPDFTALEVGGRSGLLQAFLPAARVSLVDVEPSEQPGLVLGDGSRLPFRDGSFDLVAACDTLEHVAPAARDDFVRECTRVSRGWVVLAGPYDSAPVRGAEELLASFLREKLDTRHRYLEEHRALGLPDMERTRALLAESAAQVHCIGHGNLERWLALISASMYLDSDPHLRGLARAYYRFYNERLHASDHAPPVYRHALVACLAGAPSLDPACHAPKEATPARALEPFQALLGELVAFDRRRERYQREQSELRATIATLQSDLDGHRGRLAETEKLLAAERAALVSMERTLLEDLAGHRARLTETEELLRAERAGSAAAMKDLRTDLAGHRARLAQTEKLLASERKAAAAVEQALRDDLAGHKLRLAEQERELEAPRLEAQALRVVADELTRELEVRVAHQADLELRLEQVNALAAQVNEALRREHEENLDLRAELRSRARSLLRVLTPRKSAI